MFVYLYRRHLVDLHRCYVGNLAIMTLIGTLWLEKLPVLPYYKDAKALISQHLGRALHKETSPVVINAYVQYLRMHHPEESISLATVS